MTLTEAIAATVMLALGLAVLWTLEARAEQKRRRSAEEERRQFRLALELARSSGSGVVAFRRTTKKRARRETARLS